MTDIRAELAALRDEMRAQYPMWANGSQQSMRCR